MFEEIWNLDRFGIEEVHADFKGLGHVDRVCVGRESHYKLVGQQEQTVRENSMDHSGANVERQR